MTWPALVTAFASSSESYELNGDWHTQSALTLASSEFGNLVNPNEPEMIDLLVNLWDSNTGAFKKVTKGSGNDTVENPWINMIACTTPAWIAGNFPDYIIGGGFTSRCLFIYADKKEKLNAYPSESVPANIKEMREALVKELEVISNLCGPFTLTPEALTWGRAWYKEHHTSPPTVLKNDDRFGGYLARKQTHIHKLAMVLSASSRDDLFITDEDLALANVMVSQLELDMPKVFAKIGRTEESVHAEKFIEHIRQQSEGVDFAEAYSFVHRHFPKMRDFEEIVTGAIRSGQITMVSKGGRPWLKGVDSGAHNEFVIGSQNPTVGGASDVVPTLSVPAPSPPESPPSGPPLPNHLTPQSSPIAPPSTQSVPPPEPLGLAAKSAKHFEADS